MEEVGKILSDVFTRRARHSGRNLVALLEAMWSRVTGHGIAQNSRPAAFDSGTLTVAVSCPSWTVQLDHMQEEIRAQINRFLGEPMVKRLKIEYRECLGAPPAPAAWPTRESIAASVCENLVFELEESQGVVDGEIAQVVGRSQIKYFARSGRPVH